MHFTYIDVCEVIASQQIIWVIEGTNMMKFLIAVSLLTCAMSSWANANWKCHNAVLLDLCRNVSCYQNNSISVSGQVLHISLKNNQTLTICTQNSCWRGEVQPSMNPNSTVLELREINWKDADTSSNKNYVLSINPTSRTLSFEGRGEKHPLQCTIV